jgi:apolipoprotein D and lipocalin family protein
MLDELRWRGILHKFPLHKLRNFNDERRRHVNGGNELQLQQSRRWRPLLGGSEHALAFGHVLAWHSCFDAGTSRDEGSRPRLAIAGHRCSILWEMRPSFFALFALLLSACLGYPKTVTPVENFELNRYLGTWFEIARLDHSFERGLEQVSANYALGENGQVVVTNRGYSTKKGRFEDAVGKAYFVEDEHRGYLKVSFFGPFYGSYVIFDLDQEGYQTAFISGSSEKYLWFLSRTPHVDDAAKERFIEKAKAAGFATQDLIWVKHKP